MAGECKHLMDAARRGDTEELKTILQAHAGMVNQKDEVGATALHYAVAGGHREAVRLLVEGGADINARDDEFGATPAGWAIEYLREMGGFLGIELADFAYAIEQGDVDWVRRFLRRFPALRDAGDKGKSFKGNSARRRL